MPTFRQLFMSGAFATGKWISEIDAAKAVQERYSDLPFGVARKIARDIAKAGELPRLPIETEWMENGERMVDVTPRPPYWPTEDFLYWLGRHNAAEMKPAKRNAKEKHQSKSAGAQRLNQAWAAFVNSGLPRTQADFVKFGTKEFGVTDQKAKRKKYSEMTGNPGPGRRPNNRRK